MNILAPLNSLHSDVRQLLSEPDHARDRRGFGPRASILDTVGDTPVVRLNNIGPADVEIFAKLESFNPLGSVKDRAALGIIEAAERSGALKPGQTVVEATSGNTGISLAMVCAQKGYPLVIVMAENFSVERRKLMRFLGAKVVLTPASEKGSGMLSKAEELARIHGWFLSRQFENAANAKVHAETTAREILADFGETGLDYWVTGFGTGGTLQGVARILKQQSPETRIIVAEPDNAQILASDIRQLEPGKSHPRFRPHLMQGWSPDFVAPLAYEALSDGLIDDFAPVSGKDALRLAKDLAVREGILAGISSGATLAAALKIAESAPAGSRILAMIPDTGERYLSTPLFEDIAEDMSVDELAISASSPGFRFGQPQASTPSASAPTAAAPEVDERAKAFVEEAVRDTKEPVVIFALEWCEFCWSVRKLFAAAGISYRSVDLDSVEFSGGTEFASKVRAALLVKTGSPTIPQIFVDGTHIGGATETFDAINDGSLADKLKRVGVAVRHDDIGDAYSFLPKWLHPR
ncbi:O-ureido-L-serine synthase [Aliiroseovarius pelagivivens]|uniref:Cysteine synthase B n=1 Tax=Aliiroseovarius pelagivivens TaxID=1639690 RepID=A0A2R8AJG0_9RHOB|nr:O-ureido-L-serine synthase [Aliiroseovarius pelagivivens]